VHDSAARNIFFSFTAYYHGLLKGVTPAKLEVASAKTLNMTALTQTVARAYKYRPRTTLLVGKKDIIKARRLLRGN
jgi:hypothetical protein